MNITDALKRVGSDTIMEYFLPKDVLDLLQLVGDEDVFKPSTLRGIVLSNIPHAEMLRNKKLRGKLITNMRRENKEELARALRIRHDDTNLDGKILNVRLIKNSAREKALFDFFGEVVPVEEEDALAKDMEVAGDKPLLYDYQRRARRDIMRYLTHGATSVPFAHAHWFWQDPCRSMGCCNPSFGVRLCNGRMACKPGRIMRAGHRRV